MTVTAGLISSSKNPHHPEWLADPNVIQIFEQIYGEEFHKGSPKKILFIPFAIQSDNWSDYEAKAQERFGALGYQMIGISTTLKERWKDFVSARFMDSVDGIFVGGGNTHLLLHTLRRYDFLDPIKKRVRAGMPYGGVSAGAVFAGAGIHTSNDFAIVSNPEGLNALEVVPFWINPHYVDDPPKIVREIFPEAPIRITIENVHCGERRPGRIEEFIDYHENRPTVLAMREGATLLVKNGQLITGGSSNCLIFDSGVPNTGLPIERNIDISRLMPKEIPQLRRQPYLERGVK